MNRAEPPLAHPPDAAAEAGLSPIRWLLPAALGIGLAWRLLALRALPLAHDEINVVAYGLAKASLEGGARDLLFKIPITVSNGVTPLWYWIQALPAALFGETTRTGLRLLPLLLGLAGVALAFLAARRLFGPRAAWFSGLLYGVMSLMLYTNGRGEFAESLMAPLLILLLWDLLPRGDGRPIPLRAALWPCLIFFTYFGKGILTWGAYALYLGVAWILGRLFAAEPRLTSKRLLALVLLPPLPSLLWMAAAQRDLSAAGEPLLTDIGPVGSVWAMTWNLTAGYGTAVKEFMVAGWREAIYPYTEFRTWPVLAFLAVPLIAASATRAACLVKSLTRRDRPEALRALLPLCLAAPILLALLLKGAYSARFHLLYLPILLPYAAGMIDGWIRSLESGRWRTALAGGGAAWVYTAWTLTWEDRFEGTHAWGPFAVLALAGLGLIAIPAALCRKEALRARLGTASALLLSALLLGSGLSFGVLDWGRRLAWEPELRPTKPAPVDSLGNADLQLARFFIQRETWLELNRTGGPGGDPGGRRRAERAVVRRGRPLLWRALERHPDDPETVHDAGVALWNFIPGDRRRVVEEWEAYVARNPEDPRVRRLLERAREDPPAR
jgi:hypothetical protein